MTQYDEDGVDDPEAQELDEGAAAEELGEETGPDTERPAGVDPGVEDEDIDPDEAEELLDLTEEDEEEMDDPFTEDDEDDLDEETSFNERLFEPDE